MKLYYASIDQWEDLAGRHLLSAERQERMDRCRRPEDKARCLVAGLLLRYALGERHQSLQMGEKGKLYHPDGPAFNLSHSGEIVVLAIANSEVGIDVEHISSWSERVARRFFTEEEWEWLMAQPDPDEFFTLWTAKEAVIKATGDGFSVSPATFSVLPIVDGLHTVNDRTWYLQWTSLPEHTLCIATAAPEDFTLIPLTREDLLAE